MFLDCRQCRTGSLHPAPCILHPASCILQLVSW